MCTVLTVQGINSRVCFLKSSNFCRSRFISLTVLLPILYLEAITASKWLLLSKLAISSFSSIVNTFRLRLSLKRASHVNNGSRVQQLDIKNAGYRSG